MTKKLLLFDRDGTLNKRVRSGYLLKESQIIYPNDYSSLHYLGLESFEVGIVTNQACISKSLITFEVVYDLTLEIARHSFINLAPSLFICPHADSDRCLCRKPNPGLIYSALKHFRKSPEECLMIGDSSRDLEAAKAAGVRFLGVCWDGECLGVQCVHTLTNAVGRIIS